MNNQRKFVLIAEAAGIISVFFPWVYAGILSFRESVNGFHGTGILYFIAMVTIIIITATGNQHTTLQKKERLLVIGIGLVSLVFLLFWFNNIMDAEKIGFGTVSIGFGFIVAVIATLGVVLIPFVIKNSGEGIISDWAALKDSLNSFQGNMKKNTISSEKDAKLDELEKLINWRNEGKISEEEYQDLKSKIV